MKDYNPYQDETLELVVIELYKLITIIQEEVLLHHTINTAKISKIEKMLESGKVVWERDLSMEN